MAPLNLTSGDLERVLLGLSPRQLEYLHGIPIYRFDDDLYLSVLGSRRRPQYSIDGSEPLLLLPAVDALASALRLRAAAA